MESYYVKIMFDNAVIYDADVKANSKKEAYIKAKQSIARKIFKMSKLKNYEITQQLY